MALFRWIVLLPVLVVFVAFAKANGEPVTLIWSPAHPALEIPLYLAALGMLAIGFVLGAFVCWWSSGTVRKERRHQKKLIKKLEKALDSAHETVVPKPLIVQKRDHA